MRSRLLANALGIYPRRNEMPDKNLGLNVLQEEQKLLRNEISQLKGCQLQYFTLTVTGTAALFGLAAMSKDPIVIGVAFMAPLAIILPCWWIFFDKATTITRIVGYYRVIERMIAEYPNSNTKYIGYERALAIYRKEDDGTGRKDMKQCEIVDKTRRSHQQTRGSTHKKIRHRYWNINWYTYTLLSSISCLLSAIFLHSNNAHKYLYLVPVMGLVVSIIFAISTRKLMHAVIDGEYSYNENHYFWEYIHSKEINNNP